MIDTAIKGQLKAYLERLQRPIELVAALDNSAKGQEMRELLNEILECSAKVSLRETDTLSRVPSFAISLPGETPRIHFAGLPMGHEFTSLVLALLQTGGHPPKVEQAVIDQIKSLPGSFNFETYISLSCHNCPDVVQALNLMAVLNPNVTSTMIDGAMFQDEVNARQIMAVPTTYLNGAEFGAGRMLIEEILAKVDTGAAARAAEELGKKESFDVLVVGGGPAGAAAAIYAARKGIRTGVLAERFGGQVMDTLGIENFISVPHTEGPKLVASLEQHVKEYAVDVMNLQRAGKLIPASENGGLVAIQLENGATLQAKTVILSTGARWREMNVPGEAEYKAKGVCFCPHCDGPFYAGRHVAVIGGGNSGVEAAIDLAGTCASVTVLEFMETLKADQVLQEKLRTLPNVEVHTNVQTLEVEGDGSRMTALRTKDRSTGAEKRLPLDGVFVQIGLSANSKLFAGILDTNRAGEILTDKECRTSVPGVYAAGDVTDIRYKQIVIAMGEGAKAALSASEDRIKGII